MWIYLLMFKRNTAFQKNDKNSVDKEVLSVLSLTYIRFSNGSVIVWSVNVIDLEFILIRSILFISHKTQAEAC